MGPRDAITEWHAGVANEENAIRLMRRLVSYSSWIVEITEKGIKDLLTGAGGVEPTYRQDTNGLLWAFRFSDAEAYRDYLRQTGGAGEAPGPHVEVDGKTAFGTALGAVDRIAVNAYSRQHVTYQRAQFDGLEKMIRAVGVEEALGRLQGQSSPDAPLLSLVKHYPAYWVCLRKLQGDTQLCLVTDAAQGELAAIFTSPDSCKAYHDRVKAVAGGELAMADVPGERLFELIARMSLGGICFNVEGPPPRLLFPSGFAERVSRAD